MKKLFFMFLTAGLFLTLSVNGQSESWIKTNDGHINCKKINVQGKTVKIVMDDGEKKMLPEEDVLSYFKDDKLYEKMPLYTAGAKSKEAFMEFVRKRDDMSLYKYADFGTPRYFVFKGNNLYMELSDDNKSGFEKYFNIQL